MLLNLFGLSYSQKPFFWWRIEYTSFFSSVHSFKFCCTLLPILIFFYCIYQSFNVNPSLLGGFKGVSSVSELCLARNMDGLLDDITSFVGIGLLPEPYDSSYDVYNKSSEDEDSDEFLIVLCSIQTRYSSFIASIRTSYSSLIASLWRYMLYNSSLALFIILSHQNVVNADFFQDEIDKPGNNRNFFVSSSVEDSFKPRTR